MDFMLIAVVVVALFFDFTNGFHDTANAIATTIATKAVPPKIAVIGAAVLNFLGAFVSLHVAATIAKGIVDSGVITLDIVLAGLGGAIIWNLITWRLGLPTSSSHALVGGVVGAVAAAVGFQAVLWDGIQDKVLIPSLVAPFLGLIGAVILAKIIYRIAENRPKEKSDKVFRRLQIFSGGFVAFTHGTNDAQKTMGIIALALIAANPGQGFEVPFWVILSAASAMALGTYMGGWRIIHTLGHKITKLEPKDGFAAETSAATTLWFAAQSGFPVSTTHTISGAIMGAGVAQKPTVINWRVARHILAAWVFTVPSAALVGALVMAITGLAGGAGLAFLFTALTVLTIYVTRNWTWESVAQIRSRLSLLMRRNRKAA